MKIPGSLSKYIFILPLILLIVISPYFYSIVMFFVYPAPEYPEIKNGEFPFTLTYEQNGELVELEDVYVCSFDGIYMDGGGKHRQWKGYIKSTGKKHLTVLKKNRTVVEIGVGNAMFYMGDTSPLNLYDNELAPIVLRTSYKNILIPYDELLSHADLYSEYGIKIIDWEFSEPIENTFRPKKWYEPQFFY